MTESRVYVKDIASPPSHYPKALSTLWEKLKAEHEGNSRGELARQLEISTRTLGILLVKGTIPNLTRASGRQATAWKKIFTRLADRYGLNAGELVKATSGFPDTHRDARHELDSIKAIRTRRSSSGEAVIHVVTHHGYPPVTDTDSTTGRSFADQFVRFWCEGIAPNFDIKFRPVAKFEELLTTVEHPDADRWNLVGPMAYTVARAFQYDVHCVPLDGFRVSLSAIAIKAIDSGIEWHTWEQIVEHQEFADFPLIVSEKSVEDCHLFGECQIPPGRAVKLDLLDRDAVRCAIDKQMKSAATSQVVIVTDEMTKYHVLGYLRDDDWLRSRNWVAEDLDLEWKDDKLQTHPVIPSFQLCYVVSGFDRDWREWIARSRCNFMFGSMAWKAARMYGRYVAHAVFDLPELIIDPFAGLQEASDEDEARKPVLTRLKDGESLCGAFRQLPRHTTFMPTDFEFASRRFRSDFRTQLRICMKSKLEQFLKGKGLAEKLNDDTDDIDKTVQYLSEWVTPEEWREERANIPDQLDGSQ